MPKPGPQVSDPVPLPYLTGTLATTGIATLVGGTATVTNLGVTINSLITVTNVGPGGTVGALSVTRNNGNFVINSTSGTDTSKVFWQIVQF